MLYACFYYCLQILGKIQKYNRKNTSNEQAENKQHKEKTNKEKYIKLKMCFDFAPQPL